MFLIVSDKRQMMIDDIVLHFGHQLRYQIRNRCDLKLDLLIVNLIYDDGMTSVVMVKLSGVLKIMMLILLNGKILKILVCQQAVIY
jgi:hypothetical protein